MTSDVPVARIGPRVAGCVLALACGAVLTGAAPVAPYPFEGTWIRADRPCTPRATLVRTYTAHEVTSSRSRCAIHRIEGGGNSFELVEDCRRNPPKVSEKIRMLSPDAFVLRRQVMRLKIPRAVRYARCTAAAPGPNRPH